MPIKLSEFDACAYLDDEDVVAEYLTAALEDGDPDVFLAAVRHVAKARGMTAALLAVDYLEERAKRGSREKFLAMLAKVPDTAPEPGDEV
jgi:hypothetical protein